MVIKLFCRSDNPYWWVIVSIETKNHELGIKVRRSDHKFGFVCN